MFFLMNEGSSLAVTKQYVNGTGQILPLLQSRKPKKGGSPKKRQNFGKCFRSSSDFSASLNACKTAIVLDLHPAGLEPATP
jgi:hypothetical protein